MTKKQIAILISAVIVVLFAFLVSSCETGVKTEVKTDSTLQDTTLVDTLKVDTSGKK